MSRVVVGVSGGVDSAAAAYLLKAAGHEVICVTIKTWAGRDSRCCAIGDARAMALSMGLSYYVRDATEEFEKRVMRPFVDDYLHGRTPNPCVECNRYVKWGRLLAAADELGAEYVATGHYARTARLANGRHAIRLAAFSKKDQSYMLFRLTQEQLARTLLPLGDYEKDEVREIAARAGLSAAQTPDSQEICFVTEGDYADYIERETEAVLPPPGRFVDGRGNVLGRHRGIVRYTVGQRKGLGLALGCPAYVTGIDAERNEIVIGDEASLYHGSILCRELSFMSVAGLVPGESLRALVRIRYRHRGETATLRKNEDATLTVIFDSPVRAPTPGQSAVFYDREGFIIGGGIIVRSA
ncbi:MAG: tRNA 2-thiouridine(34) synthase MnmA [Schwartzia sp.]|nr:tRNA 2-thiouridine(34) synthase MnmA [Schwartzia sp. (in: firmicutes)]